MDDNVIESPPPPAQYAARSTAGTTVSLGQITASHVLHLPPSRHPDPNRPFRRLGAYALVYLLAGEGRFRDESGIDMPITAGDLILLSPAISHNYGPKAGTNWIERYVVFEGPVFDLWHEAGALDRRPPVVRLDPIDRWNAAFDHLLDNTGRMGTLSALEEACRLQALLARILAAASGSSPPSSEDDAWLSRSFALLDSDMSLSEVADGLSFSYDGFRKRFRKLAGISPARYRTEQKIEKARYLIQQGVHTNAKIADILGYYDEQHLARRFKQITGKSPRAFRDSLPAAALAEPDG